MYNPEKQYRCTIIRGKSQNDMEDLLPLYATMVHKLCPCEENKFKDSCYRILSKALYDNECYDQLPDSNIKTIKNHLTEMAGTLLGLYYPKYDDVSDETYIYESESCKYIINNEDYPTFFKNLCLNFQFPNGAKKINNVKLDIDNSIHIKPFCYVVALLYYAQNQEEKVLLTKQEIGYYVLNNMDVLQGNVKYETVYKRIMLDRKNKIKRDKLSGSLEWQHIKEQFNLLELANIIESDKKYVWLNKFEAKAIGIFIDKLDKFIFDAYEYNLNERIETNLYYQDWKFRYGSFNPELTNLKTSFKGSTIVGRDEQHEQAGATKSTIDLGDDGEALVFQLEQERVRKYKERFVNKVLLLGKTRGLGYDISSIEADENPDHPEFARYIEVKSTKRTTEPKFENKGWTDSINITEKEWTAACQYREYYNIYRVYFTRKGTFIIRIKNPYSLNNDGKIEVYPTIYKMDFNSTVIKLICKIN